MYGSDYDNSDINWFHGDFSVGLHECGKYLLFQKTKRIAESWDFQKAHNCDIVVWLSKVAKMKTNRMLKIEETISQLQDEFSNCSITLSLIKDNIGESFGN